MNQSWLVISWLRQFFAVEDRTSKSSIGRRGEQESERSLRAKGFKILARNWRAGKDEIDLICKDDEILVFVETRTRRTGALVGGFDSIDARKRKALNRGCRAYIAKLKPHPSSFRLDVVEIEHDEGEILETRHFENAVLLARKPEEVTSAIRYSPLHWSNAKNDVYRLYKILWTGQFRPSHIN